jgi:hypothetical protein
MVIHPFMHLRDDGTNTIVEYRCAKHDGGQGAYLPSSAFYRSSIEQKRQTCKNCTVARSAANRQRHIAHAEKLGAQEALVALESLRASESRRHGLLHKLFTVFSKCGTFDFDIPDDVLLFL